MQDSYTYPKRLHIFIHSRIYVLTAGNLSFDPPKDSH